MAARERVVAVFGGYRTGPGDALYATAEETGRRIAEAGWTLLNGGYGGSMEASSRGARERGGRVIGVGVEIYSKKPNAFVSELVMTRDLWERIRRMLDRSDAFLALPGLTGTLAEIGMTWEFVAKKLMPPKPLIFVGDFWTPLYRALAPVPESEAACGGLVRVEPSPRAAIDFLRASWEE